MVDCLAGVLDLNPCGPKIFFPWNYFTGGSGNSVASESASLGAVAVEVDARLSGNKGGKSVVTVPFLTASLLG